MASEKSGYRFQAQGGRPPGPPIARSAPDARTNFDELYCYFVRLRQCYLREEDDSEIRLSSVLISMSSAWKSTKCRQITRTRIVQFERFFICAAKGYTFKKKYREIRSLSRPTSRRSDLKSTKMLITRN
jgi:hypothetical protein